MSKLPTTSQQAKERVRLVTMEALELFEKNGLTVQDAKAVMRELEFHVMRVAHQAPIHIQLKPSNSSSESME